MKNISKFIKMVVVAFFAVITWACNNDDEAGDVILPTNTITDYVSNDNNYSTLAAALHAADLAETLDASEPYTLFAPNNAAFHAFLAENNYENFDDVPDELLREILLNHVQEGRSRAEDLSTGYIRSMATGTANDNKLNMFINVEDGVVINGMAELSNADLEVDNGIIHTVDVVLSLPGIADFVSADPDFEILIQALTREEEFIFVETLQATEEPAPFTFFAPTNDAFEALLEELEVESLEDIPSNTLSEVLAYHIIPGENLRSNDFSEGFTAQSLQGEEILIHIEDDVILTDANERTATVTAANIQANNGVIHAIDTVVLPEM